VQLVLDEHRWQIQRKQQGDELGDVMNEDAPGEHLDLQLSPPSENVRMRLIRLFTPSLSTALEALYPRLANATDWAIENVPESDVREKPPAQLQMATKEPNQKPKRDEGGGVVSLPRMSRFILVAAFLASTNPAKSDIRMFGRGLDEKKRRRRVTKATGKAKSGPAKVEKFALRFFS